MEYTDLDLKIVNKALSKLGVREIASISDDEEAARVADSVYETTRDFELSTYQWAFAIKRDSLTADEATPAFGFNFQYSLPEDFLRLEGIYNPGGFDCDAYEIEGNKILTDIQGPLLIRYLTNDISDLNWPPYFTEALACRLAYEMCERLKQDPQRKNLLMQEYQLVIASAKRANAIQLAIKRPLPPSWEVAHDGD